MRLPEQAAQTEKAFESHRIQSRLFEIQTVEYLEPKCRPDNGDVQDQRQEDANEAIEGENSIDFVEKKLSRSPRKSHIWLYSVNKAPYECLTVIHC